MDDQIADCRQPGTVDQTDAGSVFRVSLKILLPVSRVKAEMYFPRPPLPNQLIAGDHRAIGRFDADAIIADGVADNIIACPAITAASGAAATSQSMMLFSSRFKPQGPPLCTPMVGLPCPQVMVFPVK